MFFFGCQQIRFLGYSNVSNVTGNSSGVIGVVQYASVGSVDAFSAINCYLSAETIISKICSLSAETYSEFRGETLLTLTFLRCRLWLVLDYNTRNRGFFPFASIVCLKPPLYFNTKSTVEWDPSATDPPFKPISKGKILIV